MFQFGLSNKKVTCIIFVELFNFLIISEFNPGTYNFDGGLFTLFYGVLVSFNFASYWVMTFKLQ